jgi:putative acetyltransferase
VTEVRAEVAGDAAAIRRVLLACFPTSGEADLVGLLRSAGRLSVSLVALTEGAVGYVGFSPVTVASGAIGAGVAPLAVLPEFREHGTAAALVERGLAECRSAGLGWAVVLGDPHYYARFGFEPCADHGLNDEYGGGDAFQVLELLPDALPEGGGRVTYAPEFAEALQARRTTGRS